MAIVQLLLPDHQFLKIPIRHRIFNAECRAVKLFHFITAILNMKLILFKHTVTY